MFEYTINFVPYKFFVFGCGGTGSRLVPLMAQFVKSCDWIKTFSPEITLIDPDIVEEKNLFRQNFIRRDLDKGKAVVLAERYSKGFDIPVKAFFGKVGGIQPQDEILDFYRLSSHAKESEEYNAGGIFNNSLIFICVDSISARQEILEFIRARSNSSTETIIVDTGNEDDFGQVKIMGLKTFVPYYRNRDKIYIQARKSLPNNVPVCLPLAYLPLDNGYFYEMSPPVETASCADLDQTMAINCMVANTAFSILQNILYRNKITAHRYNISLQHGIQPEYLTWNYLDKIQENTKNRGGTQINSNYVENLWEEMNQKFPALLKKLD
jgi:hypothetical protein